MYGAPTPPTCTTVSTGRGSRPGRLARLGWAGHTHMITPVTAQVENRGKSWGLSDPYCGSALVLISGLPCRPFAKGREKGKKENKKKKACPRRPTGARCFYLGATPRPKSHSWPADCRTQCRPPLPPPQASSPPSYTPPRLLTTLSSVCPVVEEKKKKGEQRHFLF